MKNISNITQEFLSNDSKEQAEELKTEILEGIKKLFNDLDSKNFEIVSLLEKITFLFTEVKELNPNNRKLELQINKGDKSKSASVYSYNESINILKDIHKTCEFYLKDSYRFNELKLKKDQYNQYLLESIFDKVEVVLDLDKITNIKTKIIKYFDSLSHSPDNFKFLEMSLLKYSKRIREVYGELTDKSLSNQLKTLNIEFENKYNQYRKKDKEIDIYIDEDNSYPSYCFRTNA